ncbi:MAG: hypothetical protein OEZ48_00195 [Candidatus Bathyarchaeota archaeon]|nr:hypothetical protein [Candidatus Bathyarchaeota archaeon]
MSSVKGIIQALLNIVIVAVLMTGGMVLLLGRKPDLPETIVILMITWAATWIAAIILVRFGGKAKDVSLPIPGAVGLK